MGRYMRPHLWEEAKQALQTDVEADNQDDYDYVKDKLLTPFGDTPQ